MEPHGATLYTSNTTGAIWRPFKLNLEMHGAAWSHLVNFKYYKSRMETLSIRFRHAWSRMEPHGATVYTSNTTGAVWKSFKLGLEMHGAAWNRMEPPCKLQILQEPYGDFLN